jgi:DNA-binding transcriptional ArsR family regulator
LWQAGVDTPSTNKTEKSANLCLAILLTKISSSYITLTGIKKHVGVLESAGLVTTEKIGRVRRCRLGPRRLDDETAWIAAYRRSLEGRLNRLGDFLERTKEKK